MVFTSQFALTVELTKLLPLDLIPAGARAIVAFARQLSFLCFTHNTNFLAQAIVGAIEKKFEAATPDQRPAPRGTDFGI